MNNFLPWLKKMLLGLLSTTILILVFKFLLKTNLSIFRIVLIYILMFILHNITWQINKKKIKFTLLKFSIFAGVLGWGIFFATFMTLVLNNPFDLRFAIITYSISLVCGFLWGVLTFKLTEYFRNKKQQKSEMVK
jgi:hypothetical protein